MQKNAGENAERAVAARTQAGGALTPAMATPSLIPGADPSSWVGFLPWEVAVRNALDGRPLLSENDKRKKRRKKARNWLLGASVGRSNSWDRQRGTTASRCTPSLQGGIGDVVHRCSTPDVISVCHALQDAQLSAKQPVRAALKAESSLATTDKLEDASAGRWQPDKEHSGAKTEADQLSQAPAVGSKEHTGSFPDW